MAITVTKQKPKVEAAVESLVPAQAEKTIDQLSDEELADLYGTLQDQIEALKMNPIFAKFDQANKELQKRLGESLDPTDSATLTGNHWELEIGAAARNPRALVDGAVPLLQAMLGVEAFGKLAKVSLSDIDKYLTPEQASKVVNEETGFSTKRKITPKFLG